MKKCINIILFSIVLLYLPVFAARLRNIQINYNDIFISRIKLSIILIVFGTLCRIFATAFGNLSFKTTPQFMKKNLSVEKYINAYRRAGMNTIISGVIIAIVSLLTR